MGDPCEARGCVEWGKIAGALGGCLVSRVCHFVTIVVTALFCGCGVDLSVAPGTRIACTENADCPSGYRCFADLGQCVRENAGTTPAAILEARVEPPRARRGSTVVLTVVVDQPLSIPRQ
ncbi:MAG: hypothetical protein R3C68_05260 [Myxococcota bacterium]